MTKATTIALILCAAIIDIIRCNPYPNAENVCNKTETITKEISVDEPIKYELQYQGMCGLLPCVKTRTETRMDSRLKTIHKDMQVAVCCPGYAETPNRRCAPICLSPCNNGKCVRPGICKCNPEPTETSPGFVGVTCNRFTCLAPDRWGSKCDRECDCTPNSYCSASTGKCLCRAGWRGANCTEECEPSMSCEGVELPPIIEPEANVIYDSLGPSSRLEELSPRALERELENENNIANRSIASLVAAHMGINLFLTVLTFTLIFAVFWYKKRLNQIKNELYYGQYSSNAPSDGNSSNYSPDSSSIYSCSLRGKIQDRPRMPLPRDSEHLTKNLGFASATRNLLRLDGDLNKQPKSSNQLPVGSRIESHLLTSKKNAQSNIYSDVEPNFSDRSYNILDCQSSGRSFLNVIPEKKTSSVNPNLATPSEDHDYQVPRSPALRYDISMMPAVLRQVALDEQSLNHYENEMDQSNLYEEIKPRSKSFNDDQKP